MAGLSFRAFCKPLALLIPAALLSVFLGPHTALASALEKRMHAGDTVASLQMQVIREAHRG
jgi:hypothetical protein